MGNRKEEVEELRQFLESVAVPRPSVTYDASWLTSLPSPLGRFEIQGDCIRGPFLSLVVILPLLVDDGLSLTQLLALDRDRFHAIARRYALTGGQRAVLASVLPELSEGLGSPRVAEMRMHSASIATITDDTGNHRVLCNRCRPGSFVTAPPENCVAPDQQADILPFSELRQLVPFPRPERRAIEYECFPWHRAVLLNRLSVMFHVDSDDPISLPRFSGFLRSLGGSTLQLGRAAEWWANHFAVRERVRGRLVLAPKMKSIAEILSALGDASPTIAHVFSRASGGNCLHILGCDVATKPLPPSVLEGVKAVLAAHGDSVIDERQFNLCVRENPVLLTPFLPCSFVVKSPTTPPLPLERHRRSRRVNRAKAL
jgi:hypothetical protein